MMRPGFVSLVGAIFLIFVTASSHGLLWLPGVATKRTAIAAGTAASAAVVGATLKEKKKSDDKSLFTPAPGSLDGQVILITGSGGLGLESAKRLAVGGAQIIVTARSETKGEKAVIAVQEYLREKGVIDDDDASDSNKISYLILDLDKLSSIEKVADWKLPSDSKITVLLNNAGVMALPNREVTQDGFERQMQSNHLGHFVLTSKLASSGKIANDARIINVSSSAYQSVSSLDLDYAWKAEKGYDAWKSYGQSKLANLLFTQELQRRATASGKKWSVVTLHPGVVATDLGRNLFGEATAESKDTSSQNGMGSFLQTTATKVFRKFLKTPAQGATTQIWLAARAEDTLESANGKFFVDCKPRFLDPYATDAAAAKSLWEESEQLSGIEFKL